MNGVRTAICNFGGTLALARTDDLACLCRSEELTNKIGS